MAHLNPLTFVNHGEAVRWFTSVVNSEEETNPAKYPQHFTLIYLGHLDDKSGELISDIETVIEGTSVKADKNTFTAEQLIEVLDKRYGEDNVVNIKGG